MIERIKTNKLGRKLLLLFTKLLSLLNSVVPKDENKILFYDSGRDYLDDNTEALYSWLKRNGYEKKYRMIVCVPKEINRLPFSDYEPVGALKGILAFLTSKYVFFSFGDFRIKPSTKQMVINQWHGTPIKKIGKLTYDESYQNEQLDNFSCLLTASDVFAPIMAKAFGCELDKIKVIGNARTDYFYSNKDALSLLEIDREQYKKIVLWMPTFRVSNDNRFHDGNTKQSETFLPVLTKEEEVNAIDKVLSDNNILLVVKIHPMALFKQNNLKNIKIMTNSDIIPKGVRLYEFVKEFDALITDYSSIYCDYIMLNRPIGFTLDDYREYENSRGFVFDNQINYMPGHHVFSIENFIGFINDIAQGKDPYREERERMLPVFCKYIDGNNCERLANYAGLTLS